MKKIYEIHSIEDFDNGIKLFINFIPVKVIRELKDNFLSHVRKEFIDVHGWDADLIPLKKFWKFKLTKINYDN